ncbi:MAG: DegQ family serine endoprotease [Terriglobales bacterium]
MASTGVPGDHSRRRVLTLVLVAAGVMGSLAVYRTHLPLTAASWLGGTAVSSQPPLGDDAVGPLLAQDRAMEALAQRVTPAVVNIVVTSHAQNQGGDGNDAARQFFGQFFGGHQPPQGPQFEQGSGSGVILSPDGYIVTNNHVVEGATSIRVTLNDRRIFDGHVVGTDKLTDLAVVKIDATNLPNIPWGDSKLLKPGETVVAVGNPFGFQFSVTRGIVSGLGRRGMSADRRAPGDFIQTDAAINPGNSGGALVDVRGEVVGINAFILTQSGGFNGLGFAIPSSIAKPTVDQLIKHGKVTRGYLGIGIEQIDPETAKFFGVTDNRGVLVSQVDPETPGAKAGLQQGDVIRAINGTELDDPTQLQVMVGELGPGAKATLTVLRNGKQLTLPVTLGEMDMQGQTQRASAEPSQGGVHLGVALGDITPDVRQELQIPDRIHGAVIEQVEPGGPAYIAQLQRGDVIVEVNRHAVSSANDVRQQLQAAPKGQDVLLLIYSGGANGGTIYRVIHPGPTPSATPPKQ